VEAALLFPLILFIIVGFIYFGFYLHDKYRIEESLNIAVLKTLEYNQTETNLVTGYVDYEGYINQGIFYRFSKRDEKEKVVNDYLCTYLNERLFITRVEEITVHLTARELEITAEGYVNFPTFGGLFGNDYTIAFHKVENNMIDVSEFVRMFDIFGGVIENVPGADEAIKMLQNVLETIK
jgi:hypothetical protein